MELSISSVAVPLSLSGLWSRREEGSGAQMASEVVSIVEYLLRRARLPGQAFSVGHQSTG